MKKIKVAINSFGNLGIYAIQAIEQTVDMECVGVVRRKESVGTKLHDLRGVKDFASIQELEDRAGRPDVVIVCSPSRNVPDNVKKLLDCGYNTVDSFDIHSEIQDLVKNLDAIAKTNGKVAVTAAGWDPGTDSALRAYFEAMAPVGTTFTNFGRGRSMGHSVVARAIQGVDDAVSVTIPIGGGRHSRLVYVVLKKGEKIEEVRERIKADSYFSHDPLEVRQVQTKAELEFVSDASHGVLLERIGGFGNVSNQTFTFDMRINNPALTAQVLVSCARAACRMSAGAYTIIDIPPVQLLAGDRYDNIKRLV